MTKLMLTMLSHGIPLATQTMPSSILSLTTLGKKQQLKSVKPTRKTVKKWTPEAGASPQGCVECTDWSVFREACGDPHSEHRFPAQSINQSIFYFMSVHIEMILDENKKQKHIIIIYTNFPTGLWTIDLTILVITSLLYKISLTLL